MDQHFSDILGIFKRLDEATGDAGFDKMMSKIQDPKAAKTNLALGENTMQQAARKPTGPKFVGKAPGVSTAAQAKSKLVGGCEESAIATNYTQGPKIDDSRSTINGMNEQERKLFVRYQRFLGEYGPTTSTYGSTGTGTGTNAVDATKAAKELQNTQQNLNKLKSAGVNMPKGVGTTAKSTMNTANNPNATTPTGMNAANQTDKGVAMNMGAEMEKLVATGKPAQVQQVANAIKQAKTGT